MQKTDDLTQVRQGLRKKIAGGTYITVTDRLLILMGRLFKTRPDQPFFTEVSALVLVFWRTVWAALVLFLAEATRQALEDFLIFYL